MLELRWRTLADVCDRFIACACARSHQGQPVNRGDVEDAFVEAGEASGVPARLFWFEPSMILERNGRTYERAPDERGGVGTRWYGHIESQHRNGMKDAVAIITNDPMTVCLQSDVDEIPTPEAVEECAKILRDRSAWLVCAQRFQSTYLDVLHPQQPWFGTCASRFEDMQPQAHRDARGTIGTDRQSVEVIANAGIHASWMGTDAERHQKLETFSHAELRGVFDPAEGRRTLRHANAEPLTKMTLAESYSVWWPKPILTGEWKIPAGWLSEDAWG